MSFLFVDRITAIETNRARGVLIVSAAGAGLPPWLVVEAVGQLAAWVAMARADFDSRPVAALVSEVRVGGAASPGARVDLDVHVDRFDERAILYGGTARIGDALIVALSRCMGPLLPMAEFDDPHAVRERFERLCGAGAPCAAAVIPEPDLVPLAAVAGQSRRAQLRVPATAPFFTDHFPRRPVFPATLLVDAQSRLAAEVAAEALPAGPGRVTAVCVRDFKVRAFTPPGQTLELSAALRGAAGGVAEVGVAAEADGRRVATARLDFQRVAAW